MVWPRSAIVFIGIVLLLQRTAANLPPQRYHLIKSHLTWHEAQTFCRVKHADLAAVGNMDDNNQLFRALSGHVTNSWIGLRRGWGRRWMWSDGRGVAQFAKWNEGEPSGNEWCGELSERGGWNDLSCGESKGFVCYERQNGNDKYIYYSDHKSWANSQEHCRSKHADMAYVNSEQDNSDIISLVKTWHGSLLLENKVWIGLFSDAWAWSDGGGASFRNWQSGEGDQENCAQVSPSYPGRWVDAHCNQKATFVCQGVRRSKKMVMKMMVRSDGNLTDSLVTDSLLQQLETSLELRSLTDFTLSWRRDKTGLIFQRYKEPEDVEEDVAETGAQVWKLKTDKEVELINICVQLQTKLEEMGLSGVKVTWRVHKNGKVFLREHDEN